MDYYSIQKEFEEDKLKELPEAALTERMNCLEQELADIRELKKKIMAVVAEQQRAAFTAHTRVKPTGFIVGDGKPLV